MYSGSLGAVSNRETWTVSFSFTDESNNPQTVAGAAISVYVTDPDAPSNTIIAGSVGSGVVISDDGLTVTWTFTPTDMAKLSSGVFAVFARMVLNGVTSQIFAGATVSIVEGGPT